MSEGARRRIPFDSLCLAAVVEELQLLVGAKVQGVRQPDALSLTLALYGGREEVLLLNVDPEFARVHLLTRRGRDVAWPSRPSILRGPRPGSATQGQADPPAFGLEVRRRLKGARVVAIRQVGVDRVLEVVLNVPASRDEEEAGDHGRDARGTHGRDGHATGHATCTLIAELMGKHSNLMLVDDEGRVVAAAKWIGAGKSRRPILPNKPYAPPPFQPRTPITEAAPGTPLAVVDGVSPFLADLVEEVGLEVVQQAWRSRSFGAFYSPGSGAYPLSVAPLGLQEVRRQSLSQALEQHFEEMEQARARVRLRAKLLEQLGRVKLAREVALADLNEAADTASRAAALQERGKIILAYATGVPEGAPSMKAWDFQGEEIEISLDPDLTPQENAAKLFDKAKRAKLGASTVQQQTERVRADLEALEALLHRVEVADSLEALMEVEEEADARRWLHHQAPPREKSERPYEGHAIRELVSPGGWKVLYGDNATANDYLALRVAKPNDWWLHVRGGVSAHVVIVTHNQPDRVQKADLLFAAGVAVRNSPSKHSGYVPVDYCLKKYVRRPRGAPPGTVTYSHEKTLHVTRDG